MIMKIIGAAVLILSSGAYGIYNGQRIEKKLQQTKDLRRGLNSLKQEIYLNGEPLGRAMEKVSHLMSTELKELFSSCGRAISMHNGTSVQEHLLSRMNEPQILLDEQCKNLISGWSSTAGSGDRRSELESLEYVITQLDQLIECVEEECGKKVPLYKSGGFLVGAFVVAVLL